MKTTHSTHQRQSLQPNAALWGGPLLNLKVAVKGCKAKCDIKKLLKEDAMVVKCSSPLQIRMSQGAI